MLWISERTLKTVRRHSALQWTAGLARLAPLGQTNPVWLSCVLPYDITRRPWRRLFHGLGVFSTDCWSFMFLQSTQAEDERNAPCTIDRAFGTALIPHVRPHCQASVTSSRRAAQATRRAKTGQDAFKWRL